MCFLDCKRKFPWHTNYGKPGKLRVETYQVISPRKRIEEMELLKEEVRGIILNGIENDPLKSNQKAIEKEKL